VTAQRSHVVTGAGRGIGRAIVERLLADGDAVAAIELDPSALEWLDGVMRARPFRGAHAGQFQLVGGLVILLPADVVHTS